MGSCPVERPIALTEQSFEQYRRTARGAIETYWVHNRFRPVDELPCVSGPEPEPYQSTQP